MGSTYIANSATDSQWKLTNDGITARGLNIGSYARRCGISQIQGPAQGQDDVHVFVERRSRQRQRVRRQ